MTHRDERNVRRRIKPPCRLFAGIEADRDGLDVAPYLPVLRSRECGRPVSGPGQRTAPSCRARGRGRGGGRGRGRGRFCWARARIRLCGVPLLSAGMRSWPRWRRSSAGRRAAAAPASWLLAGRGVGKTRLVSEAADGARGRGQVVLAGRSTPTDQVSPLRPLGRALLDGLRDCRRPGAAGRAARLPAAGRLTFPRWAPWCRTGRPIRRFRGAAPPVVLAEAMLRGSGLAVARMLGGDFGHLPGGAAQATSRTRRTGPW